MIAMQVRQKFTFFLFPFNPLLVLTELWSLFFLISSIHFVTFSTINTTAFSVVLIFCCIFSISAVIDITFRSASVFFSVTFLLLPIQPWTFDQQIYRLWLMVQWLQQCEVLTHLQVSDLLSFDHSARYYAFRCHICFHRRFVNIEATFEQ